MNTRTSWILKIFTAVSIFMASPQLIHADSEGPGQTSTPPKAESAGVSSADQNMAEPRPMGLSATFSYYTISGVAFQPRDSSTTYAYQGVGCIRKAAGSDFFVANLPLPDGAQIKYVRLYTYDTASGNTSTVYATRYNRTGGFNDLTSAASTSGTGYRSFLSPEITENIDTNLYSYVVNWLPSNNTTALCGVRVAYYAPVTFNAFLPMIRR